MKKGMMHVTVNQVPLKGQTTVQKLEVAMTATTVGEVLKAAGLSIKNRTVTVNGNPATVDTVVQPDASVNLRVTERPQGS